MNVAKAARTVGAEMIDREAQKKAILREVARRNPGLHRASLIAAGVMFIGLGAVVAAVPAYYFDAVKLGKLLLVGGAAASIIGYGLVEVLTTEKAKRWLFSEDLVATTEKAKRWLFAEDLVAEDDKEISIEDKEGRD